jgi:SAM-dependent methyltransferase
VVLEQTRMALLEHARLEPGMAIAEIGASRGWFVDRAGLALGPTGVVYATDIDPEAIAALHEQAAQLNPARARIEVRACADERDTGLRELPDAQLARILMIDSLCFDGRFPRARDVEYLRELLRLLAPGGRLIHHMDCACEATPAEVIGLFEEAGFTATAEQVELPQPAEGDPAWTCSSAAQRERHQLVLSFAAPD